MPKKLTSRQWDLYDLIRANSMLGRRTTQLEICQKISGYEYKDRKGTTDKCSAIWTDINIINLSTQTEKLILTERYTYWIGDAKETTEYLDGYWESLVPSLTRYWKMLKKIKNNGQYKLLSTRGDVIDPSSKARAFVESFLETEAATELDTEEDSTDATTTDTTTTNQAAKDKLYVVKEYDKDGKLIHTYTPPRTLEQATSSKEDLESFKDGHVYVIEEETDNE